MRILIAVPTFESIFPDTFKSIWELDRGGHEVLFEFVRGYDCAAARNRIAKLAQAMDVDFVLMVDNDMVLPSDSLVNLLEADPQVCLGYAARRGAGQYDGMSSIFRLNDPTYKDRLTTKELKDLRDAGRFRLQVRGGGAACMLIKTSVFSEMYFPYFQWVTYMDGQQLSEDLYFCEQCRNNGIQIHVDTRVACGHIFRYTQEA